MKTKIIVSVIVLAAIFILRQGLSPWTLDDVRGGFVVERAITERSTPDGIKVVLVHSDSSFKQLNGEGDFGLFRLALVQQTKNEKAGTPLWFVQLPYGKWRPL
jgi:hypothetical protein